MATRQHVLRWVSRAWEFVTQEVIQKSFKVCGISSSLDGTEDHLLHDGMAEALNAADRAQMAVRDEAIDLLFDDEDDDSDVEFEGFDSEEEEESEEEDEDQ